MVNREEYIDKLAARLKKWDAEIQKLEEKAKNAKTDVGKANEEALGSVKKSIEDSLTNLTNAINDAFKKFSKEDTE